MSDFQYEKRVVQNFCENFDQARDHDLKILLNSHILPGYLWRGVHPFYEKTDPEDIVSTFWLPLRRSFTRLQRRQTIFFAGKNSCQPGAEIWTCGMGHFTGLFDYPWLEIPATGKLAFIPFAEFHRLERGLIAESALFLDIVSVMQQAGVDPIPVQTAARGLRPDPVISPQPMPEDQNRAQTRKTMALLESMIADLDHLNKTGDDRCAPELLAKCWHEDMGWYGPAGIGLTYTIKRYQQQHQYPFREQLSNKRFNGHITRFAEGNYAGWFGWPNLTNRSKGGFLGLPKSGIDAQMRVVDIYRREGDKLAENWVFIDLLHYLNQYGYDLLADPHCLHGQKEFV